MNRIGTNTGLVNLGDGNSGSYNIGSANVGDSNRGNYNTGNGNKGCNNAGHYNTGDWNSGSFNIGNYISGFFCLGPSIPLYVFNKPLYSTEEISDAKRGAQVVADLFEESRALGKTIQEVWRESPEHQKALVFDIPGFDLALFKTITDIDAAADWKEYLQSEEE